MNKFITPILLGYVNRYIKNFQPDDWQVSLWEGDASFNNLELRPEVLEELKIPFKLVSGQVFELLIHVPWTRLTWEPVVVTLNTVECILNVKQGESVPLPQEIKRTWIFSEFGIWDTTIGKDLQILEFCVGDVQPNYSPGSPVAENHPSYIQNIVSKILINIKVVCNNLRIKYVDDDIVLSVHIRSLIFCSADSKWKPAFAEITEPVLRKTISVSDLAICMDQRNASGTIEPHHEPVLFRSFLDFRLLMYYRSQPDGKDCYISDLRRNKLIFGTWGPDDERYEKDFQVVRLDVRAKQILDFQLNEKQLPILIRLCDICRKLGEGNSVNSSVSSQENYVPTGSQIKKSTTPLQHPVPLGVEQDAVTAGWTEYLTNLFSNNEKAVEEERTPFQAQIFDFGFYVDKLSIELKTMDFDQEHELKEPFKVTRPRAIPFAALVLHGLSIQFLTLGCHGSDEEGAKTMLNFRLGASGLSVEPLGGRCPCGTRDGFSEYNEDSLENIFKHGHESYFLFSGRITENYDEYSLFDEKSPENMGAMRPYYCSRVQHLETFTDTALLEKTPAFSIDLLNTVESDGDLQSITTSRHFEFCIFNKETLLRILIGPLRAKVSASFIHRLQFLIHLASKNESNPRISQPSETRLNATATTSAEERKAFENNLNSSVYRIKIFHPSIQFYQTGHPEYDPNADSNGKKYKTAHVGEECLRNECVPSLRFQSKYVDVKIAFPAHTEAVKALRKVSLRYMDTIYNCITVEVTNLTCRLISKDRQNGILFTNGIIYVQKDLILSELSTQKDAIYSEKSLQCENFRVTCNKSKLDVAVGIITSFVETCVPGEGKRNASTIPSATEAQDSPMADASLKGITIKYLNNQSIESYHLSISSFKASVFKFCANLGEMKKNVVVSAPENENVKDSNHSSNRYFLKATWQKKINMDKVKSLPDSVNQLLAFQINHGHLCVDSILIDMLSSIIKEIISGQSFVGGNNPVESTPSVLPSHSKSTSSEIFPPTTHSRTEATDQIPKRTPTAPKINAKIPATESYDKKGFVNARRLSSRQPSSSVLPSVAIEGNEDVMEGKGKDIESNTSNPSALDLLLDIYGMWCRATVVGKVKKWNVYIPAMLGGDVCSSTREGIDSIPLAVGNAVSSGEAIGALIFEFPCVSLLSAGVRGDAFLDECFLHFPVTMENMVKNSGVCFPWKLFMSDMTINTFHSPSVNLNLLKPMTAISTIDVTTSDKYTHYTSKKSINISMDGEISAVVISISELQWHIVENIARKFSELIHIPSSKHFNRNENANSFDPPINDYPQNLLQDSSQLQDRMLVAEEPSTKFLGAELRWKIKRIALRIYARHLGSDEHENVQSGSSLNRKLEILLENLSTSMEVNESYIKIDSRLASARSGLYQRDTATKHEWKTGPYLGIIMRGNPGSPKNIVASEDVTKGTITKSSRKQNKMDSRPSQSLLSCPTVTDRTRKKQEKMMTRTAPENADDLSDDFFSLILKMSKWQSGNRSSLGESRPLTDDFFQTANSSAQLEQHFIPTLRSDPHPGSNDRYPEDDFPRDKSVNPNGFSSYRYVTELTAKIRRFDVVFSSRNLKDFLSIFTLLDHPQSKDSRRRDSSLSRRNSLNRFLLSSPLVNRNLLLLKVRASDFRLILPSSVMTERISRLGIDGVEKEVAETIGLHDVAILQVEGVIVETQLENSVEKSEIHNENSCDSANEETTPRTSGIQEEDKEFQTKIAIRDIDIGSGMWYDLESRFREDSIGMCSLQRDQTPERRGNTGSNSIQRVQFLPIINRFDLSIAAAPTVSIEQHLHSLPYRVWRFAIRTKKGIEAVASTCQVELIAQIMSEFRYLAQMNENAAEKFLTASLSCESKLSRGSSKKREFNIRNGNKIGLSSSSADLFGTTSFKSNHVCEQTFRSTAEECETPKTLYKCSDRCLNTQTGFPVELVVECDKLSLLLYDARKKNNSGREMNEDFSPLISTKLAQKPTDMNTISHEQVESYRFGELKECSTNDGSKLSLIYVRPLVHFFISEPSMDISLGPSSLKCRLTVFDAGIRICESGYHAARDGSGNVIPNLEKFRVEILATKDVRDFIPENRIREPFLTGNFTDVFSPMGRVKIELYRAVELNISVLRWNRLREDLQLISDCMKCLQVESPSEKDNIAFQEQEICDKNDEAPLSSASLCRMKSFSFSLSTTQLVMVSELDGSNNVPKKNVKNAVTLSLLTFHVNLWSVEGMIPWELESQKNKMEAIPFKLRGILKATGVTTSIFYFGKLILIRVLPLNMYNRRKVLLFPWNFNISGAIIWEPWLENNPRIQINADSEAILIEVGPDHLLILLETISQFKTMISSDRNQEKASSPESKNIKKKSEKNSYSEEDSAEFANGEERILSSTDNHCVKNSNSTFPNQSGAHISNRPYSYAGNDGNSPRPEEIHYLDDFRDSKFIFIEENATRISRPSPYQVIFSNSPPTVTWCYPAPRTLTKMHVYSVPLISASESMTEFSSGQQNAHVMDEVLFSLQYWCDCGKRFVEYYSSFISDSTCTKLDLPNLTETDRLAVAQTWRVQLNQRSREDNSGEASIRQEMIISPQSLAGCIRVDSYFSTAAIPIIEAYFQLSSFRLTLFNHFTHISKTMPNPLEAFEYDDTMPESQPFCSAALDQTELFVSVKERSEKSNERPSLLIVTSKGRIKFELVDYGFLTQECVLQPFLVEMRIVLTQVSNEEPKTVTLSILCEPVNMIYGAGFAQTLTSSLQLWNDALNYKLDDDAASSSKRYMIIIARYILCNDTMQTIRFGQTATKERIPLSSRRCHFYSWFTQKKKQVLEIEIERNGSYFLTSPFSIDFEGTKLCKWSANHPGINLFLRIESISTTQKTITVVGQLLLTNLLMEPVHFLIHSSDIHGRFDEDDGDEYEGKEETRDGASLLVPIGAKSTPPTVFPPDLLSSHRLFLRVRFQGKDNTSGSWSGVVPLLTDTDRDFISYQAKVPLLERSHHYSIWCRVMYQKIENVKRVLVVLSPLFSLRSLLPVSADVEVETPELRVSMHTIAKGRGTDQELYCPGTTATNHRIMFNMDEQHRFEVPLSYQMLQENRDKFNVENKAEKVKVLDIEEVIKEIKKSFAEPEVRWPFVGEDINGVEWVSGPISLIDIEVAYLNPSPYCDTLLLQVYPKVLLINVSGVEIFIVSDLEEETGDEESSGTVTRVSRFRTYQSLCSLPHHGVIGAPKLESFFHLGIRFKENDDVTEDDEGERKGNIKESEEMYFSAPLHLSSSKEAVQISGVFTLERSATVRICCGRYVCLLLVTFSSTLYGVRVLTIRSKYVVYNNTLERMRVSALCVVDKGTESQREGGRKRRMIVPHPSLLLDVPPSKETEQGGIGSEADGKTHQILGWPILLWLLIPSDGYDYESCRRGINEKKHDLYIQCGIKGSSAELLYGCPIKIASSNENPESDDTRTKVFTRMCFTIPVPLNEEKEGDKIMRMIKVREKVQMGYTLPLANHPFVMAIHEREGQSCLVVHDDPCPQMVLQNLCNYDILVGEVNKNIPRTGPSDAEHFYWLTLIQSGSASFYTLPTRSLNFPEISSSIQPASIVLAVGDFGLDEELPLDAWSEPVIVDDTHLPDPFGQFLHLFPGLDVRILIEERQARNAYSFGKGCSISVTIEPVRGALVSGWGTRDSTRFVGSTFVPSYSAVTSLSNVSGNAENDRSLTSYYSSEISILDNQERSLDNETNNTSKIAEVDSSSVMYFDAYDCNMFSFFPSSLSFLLSSYNYEAETSDQKSGTADDSAWLFNCTLFLRGLKLSILDDMHPPWERNEVILFCLDDACLIVEPIDASYIDYLRVTLSFGDFQVDSQQQVKHDFTVILIRDGKPYSSSVTDCLSSLLLLSKLKSVVDESRKEALLELTAEMKFRDSFNFSSLFQTLEVRMKPLRAYLEDRFDLYLVKTFLSLIPSLPNQPTGTSKISINSVPSESCCPSAQSPRCVPFSLRAFEESLQIAKPLRVKRLSIGAISLLVSLHTYAGVYIAANHFPLNFSLFERNQIFASSYELGRVLAVHYKSGLLLCAGWMLVSLELLGSPGGLACSLGRGIHDFLHLPLAGITQGPLQFVLGVLHGSASLMKHIIAGTVTSVTMLASSVARNLDQLSQDEDHMGLSDINRRPPKDLAQGLLQGLTGLGINLLEAVRGVLYFPVQSMINEGSQSLMSGFGKGLAGAITKPLSGAVELIALTGQGLLCGMGWTELSQPRQPPLRKSVFDEKDSNLKYIWKVLPLTVENNCPTACSNNYTDESLSCHHLHFDGITCIMIVEAEYANNVGVSVPVKLIVTTKNIFVVELQVGMMEAGNFSVELFTLGLNEVSEIESSSFSDTTLIILRYQREIKKEEVHFISSSNSRDPLTSGPSKTVSSATRSNPSNGSAYLRDSPARSSDVHGTSPRSTNTPRLQGERRRFVRAEDAIDQSPRSDHSTRQANRTTEKCDPSLEIYMDRALGETFISLLKILRKQCLDKEYTVL